MGPGFFIIMKDYKVIAKMVEDKKFSSLPSWIEKMFLSLRMGEEILDYGRDIIVAMVKSHICDITSHAKVKIFDIGVGKGDDLRNVRSKFKDTNIKLNLYAIDHNIENISALKQQNISLSYISIEKDSLPFDNQFFDVIIANQIIEHTKNIFFIFSEISRVLKYGGIVIVGVPNLAALHNRILLLFGQQPACIRMPGPHVRGITIGAFTRFITCQNYFKVMDIKGSGFYPFGQTLEILLSRAFPALSNSLFLLCQRTDKRGLFIEYLRDVFYETDYFTGN